MKKRYRIRLKLNTALHINAGVGADKKRIAVQSVYTDKDGVERIEPYIPATLLKGILRNVMEMNIKAFDDTYTCTEKENADSDCGCVMCRLFGKAGFRPSRVIIDNLYPTTENIPVETRTNNAISRYTRKTVNGALVSQEAVSAADRSVFEGDMTVYYTKDLMRYEKALITSLGMIDSIGSSKSRGLGHVKIEVIQID